MDTSSYDKLHFCKFKYGPHYLQRVGVWAWDEKLFDSPAAPPERDAPSPDPAGPDAVTQQDPANVRHETRGSDDTTSDNTTSDNRKKDHTKNNDTKNEITKNDTKSDNTQNLAKEVVSKNVDLNADTALGAGDDAKLMPSAEGSVDDAESSHQAQPSDEAKSPNIAKLCDAANPSDVAKMSSTVKSSDVASSLNETITSDKPIPSRDATSSDKPTPSQDIKTTGKKDLVRNPKSGDKIYIPAKTKPSSGKANAQNADSLSGSRSTPKDIATAKPPGKDEPPGEDEPSGKANASYDKPPGGTKPTGKVKPLDKTEPSDDDKLYDQAKPPDNNAEPRNKKSSSKPESDQKSDAQTESTEPEAPRSGDPSVDCRTSPLDNTSGICTRKAKQGTDSKSEPDSNTHSDSNSDLDSNSDSDSDSDDDDVSQYNIQLPPPLEYLPPKAVSQPSNQNFWIIYIHGGIWRDPRINYKSFIPVLKSFCQRKQRISIAGFASIDYRLSPHPQFPQDPATTPKNRLRNARHPDHIHDVIRAIACLRTKFDFGNRYVLVGHSCGATLALQVVMAAVYRCGPDQFTRERIVMEKIVNSKAPMKRIANIRKRKREVSQPEDAKKCRTIHGDDGSHEDRVREKQAAIGLVDCGPSAFGLERDEGVTSVDTNKSVPDSGTSVGHKTGQQVKAPDAQNENAGDKRVGLTNVENASGKPAVKIATGERDVVIEDKDKDAAAAGKAAQESAAAQTADATTVKDEAATDKSAEDSTCQEQAAADNTNADAQAPEDVQSADLENNEENDGFSTPPPPSDTEDGHDDYKPIKNDFIPPGFRGSFGQPTALVGVAGIWDLERYSKRHPGAAADAIASAFGPDRQVWRMASPAMSPVDLNRWQARRAVVIGSSTDGEYIDVHETQAILDRLHHTAIVHVADRTLTGSHDSLWRDGEQMAALIDRAMLRIWQWKKWVDKNPSGPLIFY